MYDTCQKYVRSKQKQSIHLNVTECYCLSLLHAWAIASCATVHFLSNSSGQLQYLGNCLNNVTLSIFSSAWGSAGMLSQPLGVHLFIRLSPKRMLVLPASLPGHQFYFQRVNPNIFAILPEPFLAPACIFPRKTPHYILH